MTLSGTVAFVEIGIEAARRAAATPGVRKLDNRLEMAIGPSFEFAPDGDIWLLRGKMPTPETRQELFDAAAAIVGQGNVIDETEVDSSVTEPPWLSTLPRLIQLLRRLDGAPGLRLEGQNADSDRPYLQRGPARLPRVRNHLDRSPGQCQLEHRQSDEDLAPWPSTTERRTASAACWNEGRSSSMTARRRSPRRPRPRSTRSAPRWPTSPTSASRSSPTPTPAATPRQTGRSVSNRQGAVRDVLSASIHPDRLLAVGYGSDRPLPADGDNTTDTGGAPTRRIEFRVLHRP